MFLPYVRLQQYYRRYNYYYFHFQTLFYCLTGLFSGVTPGYGGTVSTVDINIAVACNKDFYGQGHVNILIIFTDC